MSIFKPKSLRLSTNCNFQKPYGGGVGTGISFGVDSSYSILKHYNTDYPSQNLTHLCVFANGSAFTENPVRRNKVFERSEAVAKELNLPLLKIESNIRILNDPNHGGKTTWHGVTHCYLSAFMIYALQKLWRVYYYSGAYSFAQFSLAENLHTDPAHFEPFLFDCFSTSKLRIISSGGEGDRFDKVAFIADNPIVQKYLHVCLKHTFNCGKCSKCLRTLLDLDALGKLDNFRESFNIDDYIKQRRKVYRFLNDQIKKNPEHPFLFRSYKVLYERHKKFFDKLHAKKE